MDPFAVITLVLCLIGYSLSWRFQSQNKYVIAVFILVVAGLLLRFFTSSDFYLHTWDERYHALVAKNLIDQPFIPTLYDNPVLPYNFMDWTSNHIWLHKQPLPLWFMSFSMKLFGVNELSLRLPSILLSSIGIILIYDLGKILFSKRIGFVAAFLFSIHGLIIELTAGRVATDHYDVFFMFFILLSILMGLKHVKTERRIYIFLSGVSLGAAILTKWLPALIVLPIIAIMFTAERNYSLKRIFLSLLTITAVATAFVLPWQLYIASYFPNEYLWESSFNIKHITTTLEGRGAPFYYHFDKMRMVYGELIYVPLIWLIYVLIKKKPRKVLYLFAIAIWIIIPFLFFSVAKTKMQAYTLFAAPGLFLLTAYFWNYLMRIRKITRRRWLLSVICLLLILLPVRYSFERIKFFSDNDRNPEWVKSTKKFGMDHTGEKGILFNSSYPIETMFYTDFEAYSFIPEQSIIDSLKKEGYLIYSISDLLNDSKQIEFVKL